MCVGVQEQFIMAYGGLRGAVGFSLVMMIDKAVVPSAGIFVTTTLAVVISTVFIQVGGGYIDRQGRRPISYEIFDKFFARGGGC